MRKLWRRFRKKMISPPSAYLSAEQQIATRRAKYKNELSELTDEDLYKISLFTAQKINEVPPGKLYLTVALDGMPVDFYRGLAAIDILRERHGIGIVEAITEIKPPKTLAEKIKELLKL